MRIRNSLSALLITGMLLIPVICSGQIGDAQSARGEGTCEFLRDSVLVYTLFVDSIGGNCAKEREYYEQLIPESFSEIDSMAEVSNIRLSLSSIFDAETRTFPKQDLNLPMLLYEHLRPTLTAKWRELIHKYPNHQVAFIIVVNSFDTTITVQAREDYTYVEACFIHKDPGRETGIINDATQERLWDRCCLIHEFLHLFGAMDFYYPWSAVSPLDAESNHQQITKAYLLNPDLPDFSKSIMRQCGCYPNISPLDPLTRYLIGWQDDFPPELERFFDESR